MSYPRTQWVIAITQGRRTRYYYGEKLGALVMERVKPNGSFVARKLTSGKPKRGVRSGTRDAYILAEGK